MVPFSIFYSDHSIDGWSEKDWNNAPSEDVQIVVVHAPYPDPLYRPWSGVSDKQIQTGVDTYSINGWAIKRGKWMNYEKYTKMWEAVFNG